MILSGSKFHVKTIHFTLSIDPSLKFLNLYCNVYEASREKHDPEKILKIVSNLSLFGKTCAKERNVNKTILYPISKTSCLFFFLIFSIQHQTREIFRGPVSRDSSCVRISSTKVIKKKRKMQNICTKVSRFLNKNYLSRVFEHFRVLRDKTYTDARFVNFGGAARVRKRWRTS